MIETLLSEAMHNGTDDVRFDPTLLDAAARRNHRRTALRRSAGTAGALGAVAIAAVVVIPHGGSTRTPPAQAVGRAPTVRTHSVAFVAKQLKATLADENDYVIASQVRAARDGETLTTWIDPSTGNRRLDLDNADGSRDIVEGVVVNNGEATITTLYYLTHSVSTTTEPVGAIDGSSRLGVNVATPAQIKSEISASDLVDKGSATVSGRAAEQYQLLAPQPAGSEIWAKGTDVELYVDTTTYQLVRITVGEKSGPLYSDDLTWAARSATSVATTKLTVPSGFAAR
jgi:hypothetical protein